MQPKHTLYDMKLLIVRNDKLGDFVLSFPVFSLIKLYCPDSELHAFVPQYTSELALNNKSIDHVIIDPGASAKLIEQYRILKLIRSEKYDAIITLFSTTRVGLFSFFSGSKYRLAPATKLAQIFYNHKLTQRRSKSLKPEYKYNIDLAIKYLSDIGVSVNELPPTPFLQFNENEMDTIHDDLYKNYNIDKNNKLIFIHPGTGGSATNINLKQYAELAKNLNLNEQHILVITSGPDELEHANKLSHLLDAVPHIVYNSTEGLIKFSKLIQLCDIFISASTGPLHIAGALDRPTAAFYQRRRSATPLRWQTLNSENRRLAFTPPETAGESDMSKIDIVEAAKKINKAYLDN